MSKITRKRFKKGLVKETVSKTVEEFERKAEEARRKEEKVKRELLSAKEAYKRGLKETVNRVIKELQHLVEEEEKDYERYNTLADKYGFTMLPTYGSVLRELAQEESNHASRLRSLISELERGLEKELAEV